MVLKKKVRKAVNGAKKKAVKKGKSIVNKTINGMKQEAKIKSMKKKAALKGKRNYS